MATKDDRDDFARRAGGFPPGRPLLLPLPKFAKLLKSDNPERQRGLEQLDAEFERWRRQAGQGDISFGTTELVAATTVPVTTAAAAKAAKVAELVALTGKEGDPGIPGRAGGDYITAPPASTGMLKDVWIAFRTDGLPGTGTIMDPFDGSTATKFDALWDTFGTYTHIHIGPGTFETRGKTQLNFTVGPHLKEGQVVSGSGMYVTTIKLIGASNGYYLMLTNRATFNDYAQYVEVRDLCLDSNLQNNPNICTGSLELQGSDCRAIRVRLINWGNSGYAAEAFPLTVSCSVYQPYGLTRRRALVDGCIMEKPYLDAFSVPGSSGCTVMFVGNAGGFGHDDLSQWDYVATIRNCIIDCLDDTGARRQHVFSIDGKGGAVIENNLFMNIMGGGPYRDVWMGATFLMRNNRYFNCANGPVFNCGNAATQSWGYEYYWRTFFSPGAGLVSLTSNLTVATIVTGPAHGWVVGDWVQIRDTGNANYDGIWQIASTPLTTSATFTIPSYTNAVSPTSGAIAKIPAVRTSMTGITRVNSEATAVVGLNHGFNVGSFLQLWGANQSQYNGESIRVTKVSSTTITWLVTGTPATPATGTFRFWDRTGFQPVSNPTINGNTVHVATFLPHNIEPGDPILMSGQSGATEAPLNGFFFVSRAGPQWFEYLTDSPASGSTAALRYARIYQVKHIIFEDNYMEMASLPNHQPGERWYTSSSGFGIGGGTLSGLENPRVVIFDKVIIRRNHFRLQDGKNESLGFKINSLSRVAGIATITADLPHGFELGEVIVRISGANESEFNGVWYMTEVVSTTVFKVNLGPLVGSVTATGTYLQYHVQFVAGPVGFNEVGTMVIEDNIVDTPTRPPQGANPILEDAFVTYKNVGKVFVRNNRTSDGVVRRCWDWGYNKFIGDEGFAGPGGWTFQFVYNNDPTSPTLPGEVRMDSTSFASVIQLFVDGVDRHGANVLTELLLLVRPNDRIKLWRESDPTQFVVFSFASPVTNPGGYAYYDIGAPEAYNGSFQNGDHIAVSLQINGLDGTAGTPGTPGAAGGTGATGLTGATGELDEETISAIGSAVAKVLDEEDSDMEDDERERLEQWLEDNDLERL